MMTERRCPTCGTRLIYSGQGRPREYCKGHKPKRADTNKDPRITAAHRVYLYAFDVYVAAHTDEEKHAAYTIMRRAATDAGIPLGTRPDRGRDLVDRLVSEVQRRRATKPATQTLAG